MPIDMPGYLGAGAEFLQTENLSKYSNEVLKLNEFTKDSTVLGYIYGGINSSAKNIFWINDGTQSSANANLYKVTLIKSLNTSNQTINKQSNNNLHLQMYPNPAKSEVHLYFNSNAESPVKIELYNQ